MRKLAFGLLAAMSLSAPYLVAMPANAETRTLTATSPTPNLTSSQQDTSIITLAAGTYTISMIAEVIGSTAVTISSNLYRLKDNGDDDGVIATFQKNGIGTITDMSTFTIAAGPTVYYRWYSAVTARGGTTNGTFSINPVPSPEAGGGVAAVAIAGAAVWINRRRKEKALVA